MHHNSPVANDIPASNKSVVCITCGEDACASKHAGTLGNPVVTVGVVGGGVGVDGVGGVGGVGGVVGVKYVCRLSM